VRYSTLLAVVISFLPVAMLRGDEGLFSEVAMESVFEKSASINPTAASKNATGKFDRITGVSSLIQALGAAGFEASEENGRAAFDLNHASWRFPVSIGVLVDQDRIDCEMSLVKIGDSGQVTTPTLLSLLAAGDRRGTSFAYNPKAKMIQVRASLSNRSITADQLKAKLLHMASVAEKHSEIWSKLKGQSKSESVSTKPKQDLSLVGRWSASIASGEAFAIEISSDAKFQLVHLKSGKSTVSKGKATLSGNELKLVGDSDLTLNGTVTQSSGDAFSLAINDAKGNVAVTLDFKKAK
jgi:hypothetical protein